MSDAAAPGDAFGTARRLLRGASRVVALTGAGISTGSGIPDFRGPQGLWTKDPAAERLSSIHAYMADEGVRRMAWQARLHSPAWTARPSPGHLALVDLERQGRLYAVVTQNIDGLHQLAGHDPSRVVELHGTMRDVVCMACGLREAAGRTLERVRSGEDDPACLCCGGVLKSATISFGQALVPTDLERAQAAARRCDVLLAVGSTLSVHPAAGLVPLAAAHGAAIVIVNGEPTTYDRLADAVVRGHITTVLPTLVAP